MPYLGQSPSKGDENNFKILDDISSYTLTFDGSDSSVVSAANDTITSLTHRFVQGQRVTYNKGGGTVITGLSDGVYYIIKEDHNTIKLATSASNASNGVAVNITNVGSGSSHTLNVAFDGVNTKFKATHTTGQKAKITRSAQLVISMNGVIQQPHDTATPSTGFGFDLDGTIVFSQAPVSSDVFWAHVLTNNNVTFDISDNDIDNFTGDGSTVSFNLSKSPPDNRNILVTVDGVVQYPNDPDGTERSYAVVENVLTFSVAPALGTEVQVRHIGFAGSSSGSGSGGVTSFYGRTGAVVLKSTDNITVNDAAITGNATVTGDLTVNGTTTTLDTKLVEVDKIEVETESTNVAIAVTHNGSGDLIRLYDGASQVVTVDDEGKVGIGTGIPAERLSVEDSSPAILINATSGSGESKLQFGRTGNTNVGEIKYEHSNNALTFRTNDEADRLRINSNGKIGINTTDASHLFTVYAQSTSSTIARFKAFNKNSNFDIHTDASSHGQAYVRNNIGAIKVALNSNGDSYFTGGKVGIGTESPDQELHVMGQIKVDDSNYARVEYARNDTNLWTVGLRDTDDFWFFRESGSANVIFQHGKVGIGVTNPSASLQVANGHINISSGYSYQWGDSHERIEQSDGKIEFFTNNGQQMTLQGSNLGIGSDVPAKRLDILNTASADIRLRTTGNSFNSFIFDSNRAADTQFAIIDGRWNDNAVARIQFVTGSDDTNYDDGYMAFHTRYSGASLAERLRIDSDGAVNIGHNPSQSTGTNTQNAILTIKGYPNANESSAAILALIRGYNTTSATTDHTIGRIVFGDKQAGEYAFIEGVVEANGAVGDTPGRLVFSTAPDGTSAPTEKLRISSNGNLIIKGSATNNNFRMDLRVNDTQNEFRGSSNSTSHKSFAFYSANTDASEKVRITSDGDVGIGITNPAEKFEVKSGNIAIVGGTSYKIDTHPLLSYAAFTAISGGSYAARLGSTGTSTIRSTQIYGGGNHIATFDGVNYRLGIYETAPDASLHITGGLPHIRLENSGTSANEGDIFGQIDFKHNDSSDAGVTAAIKCVAEDANGNSFLAFYNGDGDNADERLRLTSTGDMGLGTGGNAVTQRLDVRKSNSTAFNPASNLPTIARLYNTSATNGTAAGLQLRTDNNNGAAGMQYIHAVNSSTNYDSDLVLSRRLATSGSYAEQLRIKNGGQVLIGTTSSLSFNGVGQNHNLIVAGNSNDQDITDNYNAAITISNTDNTANNTAGLHFAREDTDGDPHYNGASIVAQFLETMNTGQYPKADLAFLTSTANNNAPSEKMRLKADGNVRASIGSFDSLIGYTVNVSVDTTDWAQNTFYRVVDDNVFDNSNDTYLVWFKWSHGGSGSPWIITGNFIWTSTGTNVNGVASHVFTPVQSTHNSTATMSFQGIAAGQVRQGLQARADTWDPSGGTLYIKASKIGHPS